LIRQTYRPPIDLLGPEHNGVRMSIDEFTRAPGVEGYKFELINGVVEVSPTPQPYAQDLAFAMAKHLAAYRLPAQLQGRLAIRIDQLELSVRARNGLGEAEITTVGELIGCDEDYLLALRSFGRTSLLEVQQKLSAFGLSLDMNPAGSFANVMLDPRVFVSVDDRNATCPQPDVAAYARYPRKPVMTYEGVEPEQGLPPQSRPVCLGSRHSGVLDRRPHQGCIAADDGGEPSRHDQSCV
jgi:hypothetical protein